MKKIAAALCAAAALTGCAEAEGKNVSSSKTGNAAETSSAVTTAAPSASAEKPSEAASEAATPEGSGPSGAEGWRSSYKALIEERKASSDHDKDDRFSLDDIDMDGVPELAIKTVKNNSYSVLLYSYSGGEAKLAEKFNGALYSWADGSYVMESGYDAENVSEWEDFYELRAGDLIKRTTLTKAYDKNDVSVVETYAVDGDAVDEKEYDDQRKAMASGVVKSLGESFGLGDGVVDAVFDENGDWKTAYCAFLLDKLENEDAADGEAAFSIIDVNGDGVPELFYSRGSVQGAGVEAYAYSEGLVSIGEYGSFGSLRYYPDEKELFADEIGQSVAFGAFYVLRNDLRFANIQSYSYAFSSELSEEPDYFVNGEKVSEEEFNKAAFRNSDKPYCPLGRDNPLSKENAEALLKERYKAPEYAEDPWYDEFAGETETGTEQ